MAKPGAHAFALAGCAPVGWNSSIGPLTGLQQPQHFRIGRKMVFFMDTEG